ncbi:MAG: DUF4878 domain-containing protein [Bacteroidales bacterium]|nr:DUF4878 domain-containing protein [Bacteroidales bacterium]
MKKNLFFALVALFIGSFALIACGGNDNGTAKVSKRDSPTDVAKKMLDKMVDKDFVGAVAYVDGIEEVEENEVTELAGLIQFAYEARGGLTSYKILGEEIAEDGESAEVNIETVYGNGETDTDDVDLKKTENGWRVTMGVNVK